MNVFSHAILADTIRQLQDATQAAEAILDRALAAGAHRDLARAHDQLLPLVYRIKGFAALARSLAAQFPPTPDDTHRRA